MKQLERVGVKELQADVPGLVKRAEKRRIIVTRHGRDVAALVAARDAKLLEWLERAGRLDGLRRDMPNEL